MYTSSDAWVTLEITGPSPGKPAKSVQICTIAVLIAPVVLIIGMVSSDILAVCAIHGHSGSENKRILSRSCGKAKHEEGFEG